MKLEKIIYLVLFAVLLLSCQPDDEFVTPQTLVESIQASSAKNNVLHIQIELKFRKPATAEVSYWKLSDPGNKKSVSNVYASEANAQTLHILFLEETTKYEFEVKVRSGKEWTTTQKYQFTTSSLPTNVPSYTIDENQLKAPLGGYILTQQREKPGAITMINEEGKVVWYYFSNAFMTSSNYNPNYQTITCTTGNSLGREGRSVFVIDLLGNLLFNKLGTELARELVHHDAKMLDDGTIAVISQVPEQFDLSSVGGESDQTVVGEGINIYDLQGNSLWDWSCFDERNPIDDPAIVDGIESTGASRLNDWLHANSVSEDKDGNLLISFLNDSEIWKINRETRKIMWRLGEKGDLEITGLKTPMSGVHSVYIDNAGKLSFLDNGMANQESKFMKFDIDETTKKANVLMQTAFPKEYASRFMANAEEIDDHYLLFGSSTNKKILISDREGKLLWLCTAPHTLYRANFVKYADIEQYNNQK